MIEIRKLHNGATMIMEQTDFVRSAALGIWVRTGSSHETDDVSGVSHFIEHMMFKGTEKRSARQIAEDVDRIGGSFNAFTGKEATCYYIKTLSSNIYQGAEILLDMITGSRFATEEMDKERQVILEEIKMIKDTPDEDVMDEISEAVNGRNAIGRTILGTPESLAGIDRQKLTDYYRREYSRDSIVIAIAGNFDPDRLAAVFEKGLDVLNEDKPAFAPEVFPYEQEFRVKVKDIEQTHLCLATPSISLGDDRYYAFVLMNSIFGGSMSSRLFQNIREERGLAYSVASMNAFASRSGFFNIYAGVAHEINNPLASIAMSAESLPRRIRGLLDRQKDPSQLRDELAVVQKYVEMIQNEAFRCKGITEKLLDFSRTGRGEKTRAELREIAESMVDMALTQSRYRHKRIEILPGGPVYAMVNPQEIKQVILNLLTNALDSISDDGLVTISARRQRDLAILVVSDNGGGIDPATLENIFEPFFTTKDPGIGTGLGLAIANRIVLGHKGHIYASSPGKGMGASFRIELPVG